LVLRLPPEFDAPCYLSRYPDLTGMRRSQLREHWRHEGRLGRRNAAPVTNREELLGCLAGASQLLEIGPFDNPSLESLRRPGLQIDYADHFSREEMVDRARLYPERNPDAIPPIRYVLSRGGYGQIEQRYDAVVSHHCLEHQPDLIGHLLQVAQLLKPAGVYLFTLPDQRRCFDRFLPPTTLIDVVTAHLEQRTRPPLQALVEHKCFTVRPWRDASNPLAEVQPQLRELLNAALEEYQNHPYVDVHCWKFTTERFRRLLRQLTTISYLPQATRWRTYNFCNEFAVVLGFNEAAHALFTEALDG
jgi:SAM-dependent methyltransferase